MVSGLVHSGQPCRKTPVKFVDGVVCVTKAIDEEIAHLIFTMTVAPVLYILMRFLGLPLHPADSHFRPESISGLTRNEADLLVLQQTSTPKHTVKPGYSER